MSARASAFGLAALLFATASFAQFAPQQAGTAPLEPALEARVQALGKQLRCAVCQGMSISDSPSSMARAQLDTVRELVKAGRSDEEIKEYFVERYGEWALLEPRNQTVWILPGFAFVAMLLAALWFASTRRRSAPVTAAASASAPTSAASASPAPPTSVAETSAATGPAPAASSGDPYLDAVRSELER